eukprot:GHRQ01037950.1.p2 GENE.GHRQ01037950.1~~GHRQ01037950.1.p2  ORF type:complete len:108 (-),score=0.60 GHRQ01037950.1:569-892(-)
MNCVLHASATFVACWYCQGTPCTTLQGQRCLLGTRPLTCAVTVASAAPFTPSPSLKMKAQPSTTFSAFAAMVAYRGVRVSCRPRYTPCITRSSTVIGAPAARTLRKS